MQAGLFYIQKIDNDIFFCISFTNCRLPWPPAAFCYVAQTRVAYRELPSPPTYVGGLFY